MKKILLLEPDSQIAANMTRAFKNYKVQLVSSASEALTISSDDSFDLIIVELSLGGHSGFEFLYEFRSYADWLQVPIIVFTTVKLDEDVLESRSWSALNIAAYLYKPTTSLDTVTTMAERALA